MPLKVVLVHLDLFLSRNLKNVMLDIVSSGDSARLTPVLSNHFVNKDYLCIIDLQDILLNEKWETVHMVCYILLKKGGM